MNYLKKSFSVPMGSTSSTFTDRWEATFGKKIAKFESAPDDFLECDHCGGVAVIAGANHNKPGMYSEGDVDRCGECGHPGYIRISDHGGPEENVATFILHEDDDSKCERLRCDECWAIFDVETKELEQMETACVHCGKPLEVEGDEGHCLSCTAGGGE